MRQYKIVRKMVFIAVASLLAVGTSTYFYISFMKIKLEESLVANLKEVAIQTSDNVRIKIEGNLDTITAIGTMLENEQSADVHVLMKAIEKAVSKSQYKRMGIADLQGDVITSDQASFNISDRTYFKEALAGNRFFSGTLSDLIDDEQIQVYSVPIKLGDDVVAVLFGTFSTVKQAEELLTPSFQNQGYSTIIDASGDVILRSNSKRALENINNINHIIFDGDLHIQDIDEMDAGVMSYHDKNDEQWYFAYSPVGIKDWYACTIVPGSIVSAQINEFISMALLTWLIVGIVFTSVLLYMYITRKRHQAKMEDLVYQDPLHKHANLNRFRIDVEDILGSEDQLKYVMIDFDIHDFKMFNQLYGFQAGDELLRLILRTCDSHCYREEYSARINADHFIIMWKERKKCVIENRIEKFVDEILLELGKQIKGARVIFQFGIYVFDGSEKTLGQCNNMALYAKRHLKKTGEEGVSFFSKEMYQAILEEKKLEERMEEALKQREFEVFLQPKITLLDGFIHEAEALVRWNEPTHGYLMPGIFIPLFEKNGFLEKLDYYMMEEVCRILKRWEIENRATIRISINVSKSYIFKSGFAQGIYEIVKKAEVNPKQIELEVTESAIFNRVEELIGIIKELKSYGFSIAMDDFGSGYSSFNMLKEIPIDVIKLDQAFFGGNQIEEGRAYTIVQGIIQLAKMLDIKIVAEGIEKKEEVDFLFHNACDFAQGYFFSKPVSIQEFEKLRNKQWK